MPSSRRSNRRPPASRSAPNATPGSGRASSGPDRPPSPQDGRRRRTRLYGVGPPPPDAEGDTPDSLATPDTFRTAGSGSFGPEYNTDGMALFPPLGPHNPPAHPGYQGGGVDDRNGLLTALDQQWDGTHDNGGADREAVEALFGENSDDGFLSSPTAAPLGPVHGLQDSTQTQMPLQNPQRGPFAQPILYPLHSAHAQHPEHGDQRRTVSWGEYASSTASYSYGVNVHWTFGQR